MAVFPFEKVLSNLPPLGSKMAADVNPCFQTPARSACQVLPKQIGSRTVHSCIAGGLIREPVTCTAESGACPFDGVSCLPQSGRQDTLSDDLSGGCSVSSLEFQRSRRVCC